MTADDSIQRVRIYLSEREQRGGEPLYLAVLELLRREGATGATALRGLAGFGPSYWTRAGGPVSLTERPPVVIEWVDRSERISRTMLLLDELLPDALITIEQVQIYRAVLRQRGPFAGEATVGTIMRPLAQQMLPETPLSEALALLIAEGLTSLPVIDSTGRLVGMLLERDLIYRIGLRLPLALLDLLDPAARDSLLTPLIGRSVAQVMSGEPRSVTPGMLIPQALVIMIEQGYDQVAVVDREGRVVGLLSGDDALRAAAETGARAQEGVRDAEPPTPVTLVMQMAGPQVALGQPLSAALEQLLVTPARQLVVVDAAGQLAGLLTLASTLRGLDGNERAAFTTALLRGVAPGALAMISRPLSEMIERDPPTFASDDTIIDAARRLLELGLPSAPVIDRDGRPIGMLARSGLVRALVQQGE